MTNMRWMGKNHFTLFSLVAACGLINPGAVTAQTFDTLYNFQAAGNGYAPTPGANLTLSGHTLYGTASFGGTTGNGSLFEFTLDDSSFTNIYNFSQPSSDASGNSINNDGVWPYSNLILSGNSLYGITEQGGTGDAGTVFKVNTDGTGFADLNNFFNFPPDYTSFLLSGDLILTNGSLFGTAVFGGTYSYGTVFAGDTNGENFADVYTFTGGADGAYPIALLISGTNFYGAAYLGGDSGNGTIFKISTNGVGFTILHTFSTTTKQAPANSDGARPVSLVLSGDTLYGAATFGGTSGNGAIFKLEIDGTGFTNLYNFSASAGNSTLDGTNSDGAGPGSVLISPENILYGKAFGGGVFGHGTLFSLTTNGTGFAILHTFSAGTGFFTTVTNDDGAYPIGGLILAGHVLYGTTSSGGTASYGTIFSLALAVPPQLGMNRSGSNIVLTWPTNASGFALQSTTNLFPAVWSTNSIAPIIVNGQNTVTVPASGTQMFYRLSQ